MLFRSTNFVPANCDACDLPRIQQTTPTTNGTATPAPGPRALAGELAALSPAQLQLVASHQSLPSLSPRSSLSSVSPPVSPHELGPPPSYEQAFLDKQRRLVAATVGESTNSAQLEDSLAALSLLPRDGRFEAPDNAGSYSALPPLSPISEYVPLEESQEDVNMPKGSSSGTNTRSVSATVSDDDESRESTTSQLSVAGDSGVFEASTTRAKGESEVRGHNESSNETAQVQIKLRYSIYPALLLHIDWRISQKCYVSLDIPYQIGRASCRERV